MRMEPVDGTTVLTGWVIDQAQLHRFIERLEELGLDLLSVKQLERAVVGLDGDYRQDDVRRVIAVAGQDSHLFSTTIRENVGLPRPTLRTTRSRTRFGRRASWTGYAASRTAGIRSSATRAANSPAGSGNAWSSPGRSSPPRRCSCSTSRPRISTRRRRSD